MMAVVDASVAIKWYTPESHALQAEKLLSDVYELHAPELLLPEFGNIIWKKERRGEIDLQAANSIIDAFQKVPMVLHSHRSLLPNAFAGATASGSTVYDWTYLALALSLNCPFVTADEKFYTAVSSRVKGQNILWIDDL